MSFKFVHNNFNIRDLENLLPFIRKRSDLTLSANIMQKTEVLPWCILATAKPLTS